MSFQEAIEIFQKASKLTSIPSQYTLSTDQKLLVYAYYKQATKGPNKNTQPNWWNTVQRYKWDAWKSLGDLGEKEAKSLYVEQAIELLKLFESMTLADRKAYLDSCDESERREATVFFQELKANVAKLLPSSDGEYEIPSLQNSPNLRPSFEIGPERVDTGQLKALEKQLKQAFVKISTLEKIVKRHSKWFMYIRWSFLFLVLYLLKRK
jgi:acyl-CoA-binding protein